jgi:hypothetical protein
VDYVDRLTSDPATIGRLLGNAATAWATGAASAAGKQLVARGVGAAGEFVAPSSNPLRNFHEDEFGGLGYYTNKHQSGKTYSGKGDTTRMKDSANRISNEYDDPVVAKTHTPAANTKQSFIGEQNSIEANGGPGGNTYNKINSPGKTLRDGKR